MEDETPQDNNDSDENGQTEDSPYWALNEIADAVANLLRKDEMAKAIANWLDRNAKAKPEEIHFRWKALRMGYVFSFLIFIGILVAGWQKIIGP